MPKPKKIPKSVRFLVLTKKDESGEVRPHVLHHNRDRAGERMARRVEGGKIVLDLSLRRNEDQEFKPFSVRMFDPNGEEVTVVDGESSPIEMGREGLWTFAMHREEGDGLVLVPVVHYEAMEDVRERKRALKRCDSQDSSVWRDVVLVEAEDTTATAVEFPDGSLLSKEGEVIKRGTILTGDRAGEAYEAPYLTMAGRWRAAEGRKLKGLWSLNSGTTPEALRRKVQYAAALADGDEFDLFLDVEGGPVVRQVTPMDFEIL